MASLVLANALPEIDDSSIEAVIVQAALDIDTMLSVQPSARMQDDSVPGHSRYGTTIE